MRSHHWIRTHLTSVILLALGGCATMGEHMNPFREPTDPAAYIGDRDDSALNEKKEKEDSARKALEQMASYRRALPPQPVYPVVQPAVVRLMWVPDHVNRHGDLVPAHFYYLKVLKDRWAVTDAFELEEQLGSKTDAGNIPYIYDDERRELKGR